MIITDITGRNGASIAPASHNVRRLARASVALATPFDAAGALDWDRQTRHANALLAAGLTSITLFGTSGEGASVAYAQQREAPAHFSAAGIPPSQLIMAIYGSATQDAVTAGREALEAGCGAILLLPPYYFPNLSDDGLYRWFASVFDGIGAAARDVILYNIPGITGVELSMDLIDALRRAYPEVIAGVKDSSGDWSHTQTLLGAHKDLAIMIGHEGDLARGVELGATGAISGVANFRPDLVISLAAGRPSPYAGPLVEAILRHAVVPALKELIAHTTGDAGWRNVRAPLQALSDADAKLLREDFEAVFVEAES